MPYAHSDKSAARMPQQEPEQQPVQMAERDAVQRPKLEGGRPL